MSASTERIILLLCVLGACAPAHADLFIGINLSGTGTVQACYYDPVQCNQALNWLPFQIARAGFYADSASPFMQSFVSPADFSFYNPSAPQLVAVQDGTYIDRYGEVCTCENQISVSFAGTPDADGNMAPTPFAGTLFEALDGAEVLFAIQGTISYGDGSDPPPPAVPEPGPFWLAGAALFAIVKPRQAHRSNRP